jgi:glycine cleavage system H protein
VATLGITWYAQDQLGEIISFEPPRRGTSVQQDRVYAEVESAKVVSDIFAPVSGKVEEVNDELAQAPEIINEDPYGKGWIVKVIMSAPDEVSALVDAESYRAML